MITKLEPYQVFVFGSNASGFHGAGAAGYACRGTAQNTWREDPWFQKAMDAPVGSPERIGKWAVYGKARGLQVGREGKSYAIETIQRAGQKRSTSLQEIARQLEFLWERAWELPSYEFLITPLGEGLAGYSKEEMAEVWKNLRDLHGTPPNVRFL